MGILTSIPKQLVYEEMDGKPVYFKNYHKVLLSQATIEEIMGSSVSQSMVISLILRFLYQQLPEDKFFILTNELGLHLKKGDNLSADIAILNSDNAYLNTEEEHYLSVPPKIVIEVDLKADVSDFASAMDYYLNKTNKLLKFGVERVIWVNTMSKTIMEEDLKPNDWHTAIEITTGVSLSVGQLVDAYNRSKSA